MNCFDVFIKRKNTVQAFLPNLKDWFWTAYFPNSSKNCRYYFN